MKRNVVAAVMTGGMILLGVSQSQALSPETEMLLELLQAKGVLTEQDTKDFGDALERKMALQKEEGRESQQTGNGVSERVENLENDSGQAMTILADRVELSGLVEVAAGAGEDFSEENWSDITLSTVEIGFDASISEWASTHLLLLYEEGEEDNHVTIDEGVITIGNLEEFPAYLSAGKMYVLFGFFQTSMISDPLTLEIGETGDTALLIGFEARGFYGSLYGFNGDVSKIGDDDEIDGYGAGFGYGLEKDAMALDIGMGWINNMADTDGIGDFLDEEMGLQAVHNYVDGLSFHAGLNRGPFSLIGEYVTALDDFNEIGFQGSGARPAAWNIEGAYAAELFSRETIFALGYQSSEEAVVLGLPEERYIAAVTVAIFSNTSLSLEYLHDEDYEEKDGGTGNDALATTLQPAVEF
ncbi:MAG: LbtU family siderophore porin [Pseudomonadota bacterium]